MISPRQILARSVRVSVPEPRLAPPTELDLLRAEQALGCRLPEAFIEFQKLMGGRALPGLDVLRLAGASDESSSLVESNLRWRSPRHGFGLAAGVVAFAPDGAGDFFCFDLRDGSADPEVVLWDPSVGTDENLADLRPLHANFLDWLEAELDLSAVA
ncbi:MAG: SMI1/KNR4 family protein [Planctomycetota bacterium]